MTDFIESLEDDFGFYQKDENFYKIIDEDLFKYNFLVIGVEKKECSLLWLLDGDQDNLETLARTLEVSVKLTSEQIKHFSNLAKKFDKKLLGLSRVDKKHDKYWLVKCNVCSAKFAIRSRFFDRCLGCKTSKGEKRIACYLKEKKISFRTQKTFKGLRHIKPLKFDFYIPSIKTAIEFQGEQHTSIGYYIRMGVSNPEKALRDCQLRDQAKREWCRKNNIKLIEIHYYQIRKIEIILNELLLGLVV